MTPVNRWSYTLARHGLGVMAHSPALAQPPSVAISAPWAQEMCNAWNADAVLTDKLVESGWTKNDAGRGFKTMQIFRADCPKSARIELQNALKDNKAKCVYGGAARGDKLDGGADYRMWTETPRWRETGYAEYGQDARHDVRLSQLRRPEDGGHGPHGPLRRLSAAGG